MAMQDSQPSFLLVDGNNILHAWPELTELLARDKNAARAELVRRMEEYRGFSGEKVVLVFDGRGISVNEERLESGLQVFYSGDGNTADEIVERLARKYASRFDIVVATDDQAERDAVTGAGARVLSSDGLKDRVAAIQREKDDWLRRHRRR